MKIAKESLVVRKKSGPKITMLTSYDYPTACILDRCGVDVQLVGDSVGTNVLGYEDVSMVTVSDMLHHIKAVARGAKNSFVLGDMPFNSFNTNEKALENAQCFMNGGADGVKIESEESALEQISHVASSGIPVCAHIGYTPQTPGLKVSVQGKNLDRAIELVNLAKKSEQAGAFMIVLELIPEKLANVITQEISIPTIGIGAGRFCDGQVQVILDILGMSEKIFRHAKKYAEIANSYTEAVTSYINDVQKDCFPTEDNTSVLPDDVFNEVLSWLSDSSK